MTDTVTRTDAPAGATGDDSQRPKRMPAAGVWGTLRRTNEIRTAGVLLLLVVVFAVLRPSFLSSSNISTIVSISAILLIVTLGQTVVLISGGFDLSVGGIVPLSSVVYAMCSSNGLSMQASLGAALLVGLVIGIVNAIVIGRFGVNALISTLGMMSVTGGLAYVLSTGQTIGLPTEAGLLGDTGFFFKLPNFVFVALVLVVILDIFLRWTVPGRLIYSVGSNIESARVAGVRVEGVRAMAYGISGVLAALAGVCFASQLLAAQGSLGTSTTLDSVTAAVLGGASLLGGIGSVPGAVLGVLIIGSIQDGLTLLYIQSFWAQVISGVVLIAAVAFAGIRARRR